MLSLYKRVTLDSIISLFKCDHYLDEAEHDLIGLPGLGCLGLVQAGGAPATARQIIGPEIEEI